MPFTGSSTSSTKTILYFTEAYTACWELDQLWHVQENKNVKIYFVSRIYITAYTYLRQVMLYFLVVSIVLPDRYWLF